MSITLERLRDTFRDKEYRQIYAEGFSNSKIATQIKVLREHRGWTQQQLAEAAEMKQSRIAALEDVNYSSWSIRTLRRLAEAFDLWLDVEFKEFGAVWPQLRDFDRGSLARHSFENDPIFKDDKAGAGQRIVANLVPMEFSSVPTSQGALKSILGSVLSPGLGRASQPFEEGSAANMTLLDRGNLKTQTPTRGSGALAAIS